jgi:hypothetical protein
MREAHDRDQGPVATSTDRRAGCPARSTYRQLVSRGLDPSEAANVTAFLHGLAVGVQPWKFNEVSHLLFLRELYRLGRFGENDGAERRAVKGASGPGAPGTTVGEVAALARRLSPQTALSTESRQVDRTGSRDHFA